MTTRKQRQRIIQSILEKDSRYPADAYHFVCQAVNLVAREVLAQRKNANHRHISGGQLLNGMRQFLLGKFGCMAMDVLTFWNVHTTNDIGNIVFNLAEAELLGTSDKDSIEDFNNCFDFHKAFVTPYKTPKVRTPMPVIPLHLS